MHHNTEKKATRIVTAIIGAWLDRDIEAGVDRDQALMLLATQSTATMQANLVREGVTACSDVWVDTAINVAIAVWVAANPVHHSTMAAKLAEARATRYVTTIAPSGRKSSSNGDIVAISLQMVELDDLYALAAELLGLDLRARYEHLNAGQQRMNIGNRIRTAYKNGDAAVITFLTAA